VFVEGVKSPRNLDVNLVLVVAGVVKAQIAEALAKSVVEDVGVVAVLILIVVKAAAVSVSVVVLVVT
jgi:hypothetical protein